MRERESTQFSVVSTWQGKGVSGQSADAGCWGLCLRGPLPAEPSGPGWGGGRWERRGEEGAGGEGLIPGRAGRDTSRGSRPGGFLRPPALRTPARGPALARPQQLLRDPELRVQSDLRVGMNLS